MGAELRCARCGAVLRRANTGQRCSPCTRGTPGGGARLPADFYSRAEVVAVLSGHDFGQFFRAVRAELGLSQEQFGLLVGLAQGRVCKLETNRMRLRDVGAVARVALALGTPPDLLGFAPTVPEPEAASLAVAIAVVLTDTHALLVCRRGPEPSGITWQFPAGVVKPGTPAREVAVLETYAETGIRCAVEAELGARVHPWSRLPCVYFRCAYLAGEVDNRDPVENADALWVPRREVTRFVPADRVYAPVLAVLDSSTPPGVGGGSGRVRRAG